MLLIAHFLKYFNLKESNLEKKSELVQGLKEHRFLYGCSFLHLINDGFFVILYPLLPLIARDFNLSLSRVGILRTSFSFSASFLQLPFALLTEKWWEMFLLALGMGWVSLGLILMGLTASFGALLGLSFFAGMGGNIQHPVGSAFISRVYDNRRRGSSIGVLNFSGDIGKVIFPLLISAILLSFDWRACLYILGSVGFLFSIFMGVLYRKRSTTHTSPEKEKVEKESSWGIKNPKKFILLSIIGIIDGMVRTALLTFIPFLFLQKGIPDHRSGLLLTLLFTGGALGKLGCGFLADRLGSSKMILITEVLTGAFILLFPFIRVGLMVGLLLLCGFVLNGTSTVLYSTIAELVSPERRVRGYGLFYSTYLCSEAFGPIIFGFVGDLLGLNWIFIILCLISFLIIPLILPLRK